MHVFDEPDAVDEDETERVRPTVIVNPSGVC